MRQERHRKPRRAEQVEVESATSTEAGPSADAWERRLQRAAAHVPMLVDEEKLFEGNVPVTIEDDGTVTEGETWEAALPEPTEADVETAIAGALSGRETTDEDRDRLWDWIRADEDRGLKFLGIQPKTSSELRERLASFEPDFFALTDGEEHIGFAGLGVGPEFALLRLYLAPSRRGQLRVIAPQLLKIASATYPEVKKFAIYTDDDATARMYRSVGFQLSYILTWEAVSITPEPENA